MNKWGFLRILEAIIAITIIISVMFIYFNKSRNFPQHDLTIRARAILDEISKDNILRADVLNNQTVKLDDFIQIRIPEAHLTFEVKICEVNDVCGKSSYIRREIYSAERSISSILSSYSPKKLRLFIWEK